MQGDGGEPKIWSNSHFQSTRESIGGGSGEDPSSTCLVAHLAFGPQQNMREYSEEGEPGEP